MSQISLVPRPPLAPLPTSRRSYVPILLDRSGERRALEHASDDVWQHMTPMIVVAKYGHAPTRTSLRDRARAIGDAVGTRPIYLDLDRRIKPCSWLATPQGRRRTFAILYDEAERRGLSFMPVATTADLPCRLAIVREVAAARESGVALRHRLDASVTRSGTKLEDKLGRVLEELDLDEQQVDLVLELGYLSPDQQQSARWLARRINELTAVRTWRSVVLVATSVPRGLKEVCGPDSAGEVDRLEWALWRDVSAQTNAVVAYGDYGVQHPVPPQSGWRGPANVRYTTRGALLVSRGRDIKDMTEYDIAAMCRRLTNSGEFDGADFSWGDRMVAQRAGGRTSSNAIFDDDWDDASEDLERHHYFWRAVGTSHHLRLVTTQLAEAATAH